MIRVVWEDIYTVNVKELDDQHKGLIAFINTAYEKLDNNETVDSFTTFFDALSDHAQKHFMTEETYFQKFGYQNSELHIKQHNSIKARITELKDKYKVTNDIDVIFETLRFLDSWIFSHIMEFDKKYTKCFVEHGLK